MNVYHYSRKLYGELKSKNMQEGIVGSDEAFAYDSHISFFLAPIPKDLPSILKNEHEFWTSGKNFFEYVTVLESLPEDTYWRITETKEKTNLIFNVQDWDNISEGQRVKNLKQIEALEYELGYKGKGTNALIQKLRKFKFEGRDEWYAMRKLYEETKGENFMQQYAASVPHLMIYFNSSTTGIKFDSVKAIRLS